MASIPQLIAVENTIISLAFLAIAGLVFAGLFRDRRLGMNPLGIATGFIFFSCAAGHALHAEHYFLDSSIYAGDPDLWHIGMVDAFTLAAGLAYLAQRRRYGLVIRGTHPMLDYHRRVQMAEALRDIGQDIAAQTDFDKLLRRVVVHARDLLGADYGAIVTMGDGGGTRRQVTGIQSDGWSDGAWREAVFLTDTSGKVESITSSGRPVVIGDLLSVTAAGWSERTIHRAQHGRSVLAVPICRGREVAGALMVGYCSVRNLTSDDVSSAAALANQAAVAIEKARLIESLRQADRLKDEFLSAAAHELKTPVTAIKGWSEVLLGEKQEKVDARKALEAIHRGADRIARLSQDLVTVMSLRPGAPTIQSDRFDLADLLRDIADQEREAGSHCELGVAADGPLNVDADRQLVSDVISRLLENALRYSPAGMPVEVRVTRDGSQAVLSVSDHATSVPPERRQHIFEPFYEPVPPGAEGYVGTVSLGLYLSKQIVEAHGGRIWFESRPGGGSVFSFTLPLVEAA